MDQIAEVKVKDPTFAQQFIQRAGTNLEIQGKTATAAHIQRLDSDAGSEPSAKRLQLNSVLCSWYNPSRIVWLHFGSEKAAVKAVEFLNGLRKLRGRKLQTKYQPPPIHAYWSSQPVIHSVQVGNLDVETTQEDLRRFLRGREPGNIKMGPKSYMATPQEASLQVKDSLEAFGQLTDWDVSAEAPGTRSKAIARFANPEDARRASAGLNGKKTSALGDTKLFVNTVTSIKLSILSIILNAVRVQLEEIKARVWESTYVHIKVYNKPTHGIHTALRIFGGDRRAVSQAKSSVEKLLAGTIARTGDSLIRDPFFFGPDATAYFQNLMDTHALQGGFRRLVAVFGKEVVKLNITSSPKMITFQGSCQDFQRAHTIFLGTHNIDLERRTRIATMKGTDEVCPVCWMEPEDPVSGACGHTYCRDCASATCDHVFTLTEIQDTIPESVFENLLEVSFMSHVRAQPEIFQYCPTPDCDRIYRSSTDGRIFLCDNCITPVCTACHVVAHDGITCTEAKELGSENEIAFENWKQEQENVKCCPKCKTVIEKTYGCNHMQCLGCKVHICWFCLDIFDTGPETYAHMQERHGGINNH
ncbi:RNA recognition motif protein [Lasiodiplodia theobromae]|uniref:RNA recognition motif protein n=1 Tax=Lasiodiplodia theobromae TaxID=45133 RepID=UPI0015C40351|nr:RNA recognition motif protein [Lasiodiplodia theobromae]KAF4539054.1 RNA recognition motif protein [Lasiodiplodia theobromae]